MADFEDANSPTWAQPGRGPREPDRRDRGHDHLRRAPTASDYELDDELATLLVRPRGWHLPEKHLTRRRRAGRRARSSTSACYVFHNAPAAARRAAAAPYFYLPKMEHHLEARLWNDVFAFAEDALGARRAARSARRC